MNPFLLQGPFPTDVTSPTPVQLSGPSAAESLRDDAPAAPPVDRPQPSDAGEQEEHCPERI